MYATAVNDNNQQRCKIPLKKIFLKMPKCLKEKMSYASSKVDHQVTNN
jgi:hypothetical protein